MSIPIIETPVKVRVRHGSDFDTLEDATLTHLDCDVICDYINKTEAALKDFCFRLALRSDSYANDDCKELRRLGLWRENDT